MKKNNNPLSFMRSTFSVKKNVTVTYTIICRCGKNLTVSEKIENAKEKGWTIHCSSVPMKEEWITDVFCPECHAKEMERLFNSEDLRERIRGEYYKKFPEKFQADALEYVGLSGHPKADDIYSKAWDEGHYAGDNEVLCRLESLAGLFQ